VLDVRCSGEAIEHRTFNIEHRTSKERHLLVEFWKDHRAGGSVEADDGEFVNRAEGFGPENFVGGSAGGDGAVVEKNQLIGEGRAEVDVVGGEDHGQLLLAGELAEEFEQIDLVVQIKKRIGLIEKEDARFLDEAAGEEHALALAAGEVVDGAGEQIGQIEELGVFLDDIHVVLGFEAKDFPVGSAAESQMVADGVGGIIGGRLRQIGDAAGEGFAGPVVQSAALPGNRAGGAEVAEEDFDEGGFAGAIGAEHGENLAGVEGEGDVVEDGFVGGVGEVQVFGGEDWISHGALLAGGLTTEARRHGGQLVDQRNLMSVLILFFFLNKKCCA